MKCLGALCAIAAACFIGKLDDFSGKTTFGVLENIKKVKQLTFWGTLRSFICVQMVKSKAESTVKLDLRCYLVPILLL